MEFHRVDARRLLCPMPVIRLQNAVAQAQTGDKVEIVCTDPGAMNDIPAWCRINKHLLESIRELDREYCFVVEVGDSG